MKTTNTTITAFRDIGFKELTENILSWLLRAEKFPANYYPEFEYTINKVKYEHFSGESFYTEIAVTVTYKLPREGSVT